MVLAIALLTLSSLFFWAGFKAARHPLQHQSQAGFVMSLALAGFVGYFAWREARTMAELAKRLDLPPETTDVRYVPRSAEVASLSDAMAAMPGLGRFGSTQEERRQFAENAAQRETDYWLVKTALPPDSILSFYRTRASSRGWSIETDTPPWMTLSQAGDRMVLFVRDESPQPGSTVLFGYIEASGY